MYINAQQVFCFILLCLNLWVLFYTKSTKLKIICQKNSKFTMFYLDNLSVIQNITYLTTIIYKPKKSNIF